MNAFIRFSYAVWLVAAVSLIVGCGNNPMGSQVKEPFQGNKYESNNRYFRSTGKASSSKDAIAQSKAEMDARTGLAQQLQTTIQVVTDNYSSFKPPSKWSPTITAKTRKVNTSTKPLNGSKPLFAR